MSSSRADSYQFKWANYDAHLSDVVHQLLDEECMLDVSLCAGGERIKAHRLVLCSCSTLFQEILSQVNDEHSTVILSEMSPQDVRSIVEFCYKGEVRIPIENISNLLEAAQSLRIRGLEEIEGLDETEGVEDTELIDKKPSDTLYVLENFNEEDSIELGLIPKTVNVSEKKVKRRSVCKKDYTDDMLEAAIQDIRRGTSLLEAASKNHIPRSTLYMQAKKLGIPLNPTRFDYTIDDMRDAINDVIAGSSLQQAAFCHGIPKTVLWRRLQKEGCERIRRDTRKNYASERREAAIKALERGEGLTKVANEYQIPKTTLFRDKTRLVVQGKLPSTFYRKRKSDGEDKDRLEEAIVACKSGKMSQATASIYYQIPKTTIWRGLQRDAKKSTLNKTISDDKSDPLKCSESIKSGDMDEGQFETYCVEEDDDENITYIDDTSVSNEPVTILAAESIDEVNASSNSQLEVEQETEEHFISCGLGLEEPNFDQKS